MYADVIVDIVHSEVDKLFEYSTGNLNVKPGHRVMVPFGKRVIEGIVMRLKNSTSYDSACIKPIFSILEETPVLTEETLSLADFVSNSYYVAKASALRLFLPSEMRKGKIRELFKKVINLTNPEKVDEILASLRKTAVKQKEFLCYLLDNPSIDFSVASNKFGASAVNAVLEKGVCEVTLEKISRSPYKNDNFIRKNITLTTKQNEAIASINSTDKLVSLIYGVTGSGKTEVYLELIEQVINKGQSAIMLVPEISLTPQMLRQLRGRFGDNAAILHSGLSAGERFDEWWRLRTGEAKIAIGARSAVFAPVSNLGIVIIDEEHDASYQSESSPRYVTKEIAIKRAEYFGAKIALGSATPSLESFKLAKDGIYNLISESKQTIFQPKISITKKDIESIPYLKQLRETINLWDQRLKCTEGKDAFTIKKALIEMRKDQYIIKSAYTRPITPNKIIRSKTTIKLDDTTEGLDNPTGISLLSPSVCSAILCNYSRLKQDSSTRLEEDLWYLMYDFDNISSAALAPYPMYERIVEYKIDGKQNVEIQKLLQKEFNITHSLEYISSLWRNKIPKLIASEAEDQYYYWYYREIEKGKYKKCSRCGQIKLAHNKYFSKNKTSKDSFYSICKACRNSKRKENI